MQFLNALVVLATEEGGESGGGLSLVLPHPEELIAGILAFLIVFFFVWRRALPTINKTLEARQQAIIRPAVRRRGVEARGRESSCRLPGAARRGQDRGQSDHRGSPDGRRAIEGQTSWPVPRRRPHRSWPRRARRPRTRRPAPWPRPVARWGDLGRSCREDRRRIARRQDAAGPDRSLPGGPGASVVVDERISGYATAILDLAEAEGELGRVESRVPVRGPGAGEVR